MPFKYKRTGDVDIKVTPAVIEDYKVKTTKANAENTELSVAEREKKFSNFETLIGVADGKLQFKSYTTFGDRRDLSYVFELPANDDGLTQFKAGISIYAGLMGWIPNGIQNSFNFIAKPTKYEHDGIHAYTVSSSGLNRKLRLQDYEEDGNKRGYERTGGESQRLYRAIDGADKYFDKVHTSKPMTVFRGMPLSDALKYSGRKTIETMSGGIITNTAYTSSTLNLHSTLMFAKTTTDPTGGVILAIDLPVGLNADYIHNIAGWKEQFEVLWDRKYDIQVGEHILSFKGGKNFTYHIFKAGVVQHVPLSPIPSWMDISHHANVPNIQFYDRNGRINFDYQAIQGTLLEAFDILKKKGITGLQFQKKLQFDLAHRDYIIAHAGEGDDDTLVDLGFTYNTDTKMIDVMKFTSANGAGDKGNSARNYWTDAERNAGAIDRNFTWETYNANDEKMTASDFDFDIKSSIMLRAPKNGVVDLEKNLPSCVAFTILEYLKYNKDVTLLPMQDVARYFDTVFKTTILEEGYELKDSMPVNRVGKDTDENDGYVPLKYHIDGDDDDSLVLMMRMARSENGKLQLEYRGASANNRVKESDTLRWNIFNQEIMERECNKILYIFASKLNLNHTRKSDQLLNFVAKKRGFTVARANNTSGEKVERNIHQKGNHKMYRMWYPNRKDNIKVTVDVEKGVMDFYLLNNRNKVSSFKVESKLPILGLYRAFVERVTELEVQ